MIKKINRIFAHAWNILVMVWEVLAAYFIYSGKIDMATFSMLWAIMCHFEKVEVKSNGK